MIRFEHTIDVHRPVEEVFAFLADFTNVPRWNYYVDRVRQLTPGPAGLGTVYEQVRRSDRQRYQVSAHQPPHLIRVATLPGEQPGFDRQLQLRATAGAITRIHDRWELDTGHPRVVQRLASGRVGSAVGANLAILKELLEHGAAYLQDGRRTALSPADTASYDDTRTAPAS